MPPPSQQEAVMLDSTPPTSHANHASHSSWWYDDPRSYDDESDQSTANTPSPSSYGGGFINDSMRTDGFAGQTTAEQRRVADTATATANTLALPTNVSDLHCPQCGVLTENGFTFHQHIAKCYIAARTPTTRSPPPHTAHSRASKHSTSSAATASSIATLQTCLSSLDLHERISLMEALFRLSRSTAAVENDHSHGHNVHLDERVISLLYSSPQPQTPASSITFGNDSDSVASPVTPPLSPYSHTCLTPSLHNVSFHDDLRSGDHVFSPQLHDETDGAVPFKRQRAFSQPHIKTLNQHYSAMQHTTQLTRQYSPVHIQSNGQTTQSPYIQPFELPQQPPRQSSGKPHSKRLFVNNYSHQHSTSSGHSEHRSKTHFPASQSFTSITTQSAPSSTSTSPVSSPNNTETSHLLNRKRPSSAVRTTTNHQ